MEPNVYDVQIFACKMVKICWKTCLTTSINHPYVSSSFLLLLLLYTCFPLVFWILIYSIPLVVCSCIALSLYFNVGNVAKYEDEGGTKGGIESTKRSKFDDDPTSKKPYARVHSVRRRRAKEIIREEEEKKAVSSTNFNCELVDKNPLIEETSPKEIREVEVDSSLANNNTSPVKEHHEKEDENKEDHVMDVVISDAERTKRLESLIARRRSRKLLSLQVRRSLMNMDRKDHPGGQMPSLMIPKFGGSSKFGAMVSPGPGSAPSILIPMTNPFDLPYEPQEEKPDLTGDSFHKEFTSSGSGRDMIFCRHESFSLGPSSPDQLFEDETSSLHGFGFRHSRKFSPITEQEMSESKTGVDDDDQIKEVIQVYDHDQNGTHNPSEESNGEDEMIRIPQSDFNTSSTSPPSSSSEEESPMFKIDREAILKSLSSMRRNALQEIESNEQTENGLSDANSALENASRLKQKYFANKPLQRHTPSYSIASDMQVEVSEISSPPLTIDENMSYQDEDVSTYDGEMERNISWDGDDMWARGSSHISEADGSDSRSLQVNEEDMIDVGVSRALEKPEEDQLQGNSMEKQPLISENEDQIKEYEAVESNTEVSNYVDEQISTVDGNEDQEQEQEQTLRPNVVQSCVISPNSVLLPTLSLSSFDPDVDEEVHNTVEVPTIPALQNLNAEASQESSEPANDEMKNQENDEQANEVAHSSSEILGINENHSKDSAAVDQNESTQNMDDSDNLIPSLSTREEMVDGAKTSDYEDRSENSALHEETGNDSRQINSETSISFDGIKDEVQDLVALSEPVEENENSETCKKNEGDRKDEESANANEAMQETLINAVENETE